MFMTSITFSRVSVCAVGALIGCMPIKSYRLNPDVDPAEYRIVCRNKSAVCRSEAAKLCDSEYQVISQSSNFSEPDMNSPQVSQAPTTQGEWQGELLVRCSGGPPPIALKRKAEASPPQASARAPAESQSTPAVSPANEGGFGRRVCVPGVTQACLGPGACSGAQSCTPQGTGFADCDCGLPVPETPDRQATPPVGAPSISTTAVPPAPSATPDAPEPE